MRPHTRGLRSRSRSASPLPPTPPHSPMDAIPSTSERNIPKSPHIQLTPHQPDPAVSSRKPPARKAEPMDHSGRTSPELLLSSLSNLAASASVDGNTQEKSSDGLPLERTQHNKPAEQASQEGTKADGGAKAGQLVVLKQAEKRRSPSPNELLGLPVKRHLSTEQAPPPSSKKPKTIQGAPPSASLHGPLRLGLKTEGSSASKVLTEEFQKQQGQENAKVKASILKEIRKPGKSEYMRAVGSLVQLMYVVEACATCKKNLGPTHYSESVNVTVHTYVSQHGLVCTHTYMHTYVQWLTMAIYN